ncbi:hypothetical protein BH23VER1_BH23VER1_00070 [soil metagenome]
MFPYGINAIFGIRPRPHFARRIVETHLSKTASVGVCFGRGCLFWPGESGPAALRPGEHSQAWRCRYQSRIHADRGRIVDTHLSNTRSVGVCFVLVEVPGEDPPHRYPTFKPASSSAFQIAARRRARGSRIDPQILEMKPKPDLVRSPDCVSQREGCDLRRPGQELAVRGGRGAKKKAVVATARRLEEECDCGDSGVGYRLGESRRVHN